MSDKQDFTQADFEKAVAEGVAAEQSRISAILSAGSAAECPTLANAVASMTSLSAAEAKLVFEAFARDREAAASQTLAQRFRERAEERKGSFH